MARPGWFLIGSVLVACGDADTPQQTVGDTTVVAATRTVVVGGDTMMQTRDLRCADGRLVAVSYLKGATERVAVNLGDTSLSAPATSTDSGARYATPDESFILWDKGDTTSLTWQGRLTTCVVDPSIVF